MPQTELELNLRAGQPGTYALSLRLQHPGSDADAELASDLPAPLDQAALLTALGDHETYGRLLSAMVFADPQARQAWGEARAFVRGAGGALRLRLRLGAEELHSLCWEALRDPDTDEALASSGSVLLSRYLPSRSLRPVRIPARGELSALVVAAAPTNLEKYGLAPLRAADEADRACQSLGLRSTVVLGPAGAPRATLEQLTKALEREPHILYLVCHGRKLDAGTLLWLEDDDGRSAPVHGAELVKVIRRLGRRPLLAVLAACMSAGRAHDDGALAALAPQLARAGIAAVVAAQGNITLRTSARLFPALFQELYKDGEIDRALAAARFGVRHEPDWALPVLFLRARGGRLWREGALMPPALPQAPGAGWTFELSVEVEPGSQGVARALTLALTEQGITVLSWRARGATRGTWRLQAPPEHEPHLVAERLRGAPGVRDVQLVPTPQGGPQ